MACCGSVLGAALACGDGGPVGVSAAPGTIAYLGFHGGQRDIWIMNADGSNHRNLTRDANDEDHDPDFSPDGWRIVYVDYTAATGYELAIMNADGTDQRLLTDDTAWVFAPSWAPDGLRLAFEGRNHDVEVMNLNGTGRRSVGEGGSPDWSPDGERLAVTASSWNAFPGIHVLDADGTNRIRISPDTAYDANPAWSPDGTQIAYGNRAWIRELNDFVYSIGVMNADGSNRRRLIGDSTNAYVGPAWSPDGQMIVFMSTRDGTEQLYRINVDGTNLVRLTRASATFSGNRSQPSWTSRVH